MAKANDKSTIIDWIWLHDALLLATKCFGSAALAKAMLTEWLAAGKLPWSCMAWHPLDVEGLEEREDKARELGMFLRDIPPACREGEPEFWRSDHTTRWEDNIAHQNSVVGAGALGIKVSREHFVALLPEDQRKCVVEQAPTMTSTRELLEPKAWLAWACEKYPKRQNERATPYVRRLHGLMQTADNVTQVWTFETFRVRYYEAVKTDQPAVLKKRNSPRPE
jgi:hypothetical protein